MVVVLSVLFFAAFLGGMVVMIYPTVSIRSLQSLLTFSGGYLLAMLLLHLLPELFVTASKPLHIGVYIIIGFFLQCFIESFSAGIAHSHSMTTAPDYCCINSNKIFALLVFIMVHALLDGTILAHEHVHGCCPPKKGLLWGIVLHKFLESFTLMSLLKHRLPLKRNLSYLVMFSLMSPLGLWLNSYINYYLASGIGTMVLAIVTGNFLYITMTILFEANLGHTSNQLTPWISLLGAGVATCIECLC